MIQTQDQQTWGIFTWSANGQRISVLPEARKARPSISCIQEVCTPFAREVMIMVHNERTESKTATAIRKDSAKKVSSKVFEIKHWPNDTGISYDDTNLRVKTVCILHSNGTAWGDEALAELAPAKRPIIRGMNSTPAREWVARASGREPDELPEQSKGRWEMSTYMNTGEVQVLQAASVAPGHGHRPATPRRGLGQGGVGRGQRRTG